MDIRKDRAIAGGLILLLLLLYSFSLTRSLVSPPSEYMSREIPIIETEYGFSRTVNSHILTRVFPSGDSALVLCIDGTALKILEIDIQGQILNEKSFKIDLSQASQIEISSLSRKTLGIVYKTDALYHADLSLDGGTTAVRKMADNVLYFNSHEEALVFGNHEGLFVLSPEITDPLKIFSGRVLDFKLACDDSGCYTVIVHDMSFDTVRLELLFCSPVSGDCEERMSLDVSAKYFSDLQDLRIDDGILTVLYKYEDGRNRSNQLTFQKIKLPEGGVIFEERVSVPLYHSNYRLLEGSQDDSRFIYQTDSVNGVNLAMGVIGGDGEFSSHLITKTKSMSKLAGSFMLGEKRALVFSDINYDRRALFFASDDSQMIKSTTRFRTVPFWYPLLTTLLIYLVSLFSGSLYLLALLPLPVLFLFVSDHYIFHKMESPELLQNSLTAGIHTIVKLLLTYMFISSTFNYSFQPAFIGAHVIILPILILFSLASAGLSMSKRGVDFYISFAVYDYLFYTGLITMYLTTSILLGKV
ncbi:MULTISPECIES: hypothetical protein [unclassified Oceanispirochaeta]|uniref:hypothetical protein n=1 Tax=unclassified Oceanispirochaeta TaxID=2635722 RepID=UPI000E09CBF8|nr:MULTISPECIES: hypothetical protein [unclassified Oceanispirochaeta]MBF9014671.1 hypothetical protein [Oceanispirochaeta sp. M2]NPD70927.1 hypothetical protein [Oceanispirochaeta sp. M1]RDG33761.1 hypothetical protein DV872_02345 [Oceanispirochaeta sp. M1]